MLEAIVLGLLTVAVILWVKLWRRDATRPPMPANRLPVVGHLLEFTNDPENILQRLSRYARELGPIFGIQLGAIDIVVVSDFSLLPNLLRDQTLLTRPTHPIYEMRGKSIVWGSGAHWKLARKLTTDGLRQMQFGRGARSEVLLREATRGLLATLAAAETCDPFDAFSNAVLYSTNLLIFGQSSDEMQAKLIKAMTTLSSVKLFTFSVALPWLSKLHSEDNCASDLNRQQQDICRIVKEAPYTAESFIHLTHDMPEMDDEARAHIVNDIIMAGTKTTSLTLLWLLLYLLHHKNAMVRARDEVDALEDMDNLVYADAKDQTPFLVAVIREVMRLEPAAPLMVPRLAPADLSLGGYHIRANEWILINLREAFRDASVYSDPHDFKPERWLVDQPPPRPLPFSSGPRHCLGEGFATIEIYHFIVAIIRYFTITAVNLESAPLERCIFGTATNRPLPYSVHFTCRTTSHDV